MIFVGLAIYPQSLKSWQPMAKYAYSTNTLVYQLNIDKLEKKKKKF